MAEPSTWHIVEQPFDPGRNQFYETLFALGNGYLGLRGTFEEGLPPSVSVEGTYINGFYDTEPIIYGEKLYGFAENRQTMLNLPNAKIMRLYLEDEAFTLQAGTLLEYRRWLDMREGVLYRQLTWRSPQGRELRLETERLVLLARPHLALIRYRVTPLNFSGELRLLSALDGMAQQHSAETHDPRLGAGFKERVLFPEAQVVDGTRGRLQLRTKTTGFRVACGIEHALATASAWSVTPREEGVFLGCEFTVAARAGEPFTLEKTLAYVSTRAPEAAELLSAVDAALDAAAVAGFEALKAEQRAYLAEFWERTDILIAGDEKLQRGLRFNMFHLLQSVGKDGRTNIAAKGLTGEGYEGHTFWDTEIYILPFFLYNNPEISRKLLEYRYHTLPQARERARQLAHPRGALFPWRTIGGEECSPFFPAGTAQYHIDADIAFAVKRYWEATEDAPFMRDFGVELLCETARLWADVGHFAPGKGFCIFGVTGPDEYTCVVDNNAYTNLMARENLRFAWQMADWLRETDPAAFAALAERIGLAADEPAAWQAAADAMYIPYDAERGIIPQDDSFLSKPVWDFAHTPKEHYPLLLHYHPLVLYRHQVCKQADLVLAEFLLSDQFDRAQKQRDFAYYEPLTTHDSSLSPCIFGIMAAELGDHEKAYHYFVDAAITDLENKKGNTQDGIHAANMAGAWQMVVFGFAGMRVTAEGLSFAPMLPPAWQGYAFKIRYRGRVIAVDVRPEGTQLRLLAGAPLIVRLHGEAVRVS